jgi:serpin B
VDLLIKALYFKGRWRIPFDPARTRPLPFHGANGVTRTVPMMSLEPRPLRYVATPDYQAVDLLYGNGAFALTLLLPEPGHQTADLLAGLASGGWETLAGSFGEHTIGLVMPKFRMDYSRSLREDLTALGMGIAFDPARADLSGIADVRPERLYLTRVIQKTFVEVNEEGTEAAAATAVGVGVTSMPPVMTVDRPFLFAIRERLSNTILFIGQINQLP